MKKWQEWTIVGLLIVVVVAVIGVSFWYLTNDEATEVAVVDKTEEQKDLDEVEESMAGIEDLDLSALESIDEDLQAIDLAGL